MTQTMNLLGLSFEIAAPYAEGHQLSAIEASALNGLRLENVRNNVRRALESAFAEAWEILLSSNPDLPKDPEVSQLPADVIEKFSELVAKTDSEYAFGQRRKREASSDNAPSLGAAFNKVIAQLVMDRLKKLSIEDPVVYEEKRVELDTRVREMYKTNEEFRTQLDTIVASHKEALDVIAAERRALKEKAAALKKASTDSLDI